jgi:hypothetical protein
MAECGIDFECGAPDCGLRSPTRLTVWFIRTAHASGCST